MRDRVHQIFHGPWKTDRARHSPHDPRSARERVTPNTAYDV